MPVTPTVPPLVVDRLAMGVGLYQKGEFAAAAEEFAVIVEAEPNHADATRLQGLAYFRSGRREEGLRLLSRATAVAPRSALSHLHHGIGLLENGAFVRAAARLRRAVTIDPAMPAGWINFSSALLALNQTRAARSAARRALKLMPGNADALHMLGRSHAACGDLEAARQTFSRLLQHSPDRLEAWIDLGQVHARAGNMGWARQAMQRVLAIDQGHAAASANLAAFGLVTGDILESIATLRETVARAPGCIPAHLNLANALLLEREVDEALAVLKGPAPPGREGRHWLAHKALALLLKGRMPEAEQTLDAIPEPYGDAEILIVSRRMHLARLKGDAAGCERLAERLEGLILGEKSLFEHRIVAAFDLARLRNGQGDGAAAFAHWTTGHRLMSHIQPFDRKAFTDFVDTSIEVFGAAGIRAVQAKNADPAPVFIVGLPRSGTTLTEQVLAAHAQVHGAGERKQVHDLITSLAGPSLQAETVRKLAGLRPETVAAEGEAFLAALHEEAPDARYIVDKMPGNALHLGFISALLPGAKFILTRRDLRDTGLSIFEHRFFGYHPYAHDLEDLGFYMAEHERLIRHWLRIMPDRIIEIALEDWVSDFAGTLSRLEEFLALPHDPASLRFHENRRRVRTASAAQVRQPINARGLGRWHAFAEQLGPMIEQLATCGLVNE